MFYENIGISGCNHERQWIGSNFRLRAQQEYGMIDSFFGKGGEKYEAIRSPHGEGTVSRQ